MKQKLKFLLSWILVFAMLCSTLPLIMQASAENVYLYYASYPRSEDSAYGGPWGHGELHFMNGWFASENQKFFDIFSRGGYNGKVVYCIEPGAVIHDSNDGLQNNSTMDSDTFWSSVYSPSYSNGLPAASARAFLGQILNYGYKGNANLNWRIASDADVMMYAYATQILVWEVIVGERDEEFNHIDPPVGVNKMLDRLKSDFPLRDLFMQKYKNIVSKIQNVAGLPSFASDSAANAPTYTMSYDNGVFSITLHNTNGKISDSLSISSELQEISFTRNGSDLIITSTEEFEGVTPIHMSYGVEVPDPVVVSNGLLKPERTDSNSQDIIYFVEGDTTYIQTDGYFNLEFPHVHRYIPFYTDPDCIHRGYITWVCRCGDSYVNNYKDALGHNFCPVSKIQPTCETEGQVKYVCTRCGASYITTTPATGHTEPVWVIHKKPTCTKVGERLGFCKTCGFVIQSEDIPATGHGETVWRIDFDATPEHDGQMTEYCTVCGEAVGESKSFPMHTHEADFEKTLLEATCKTEGEMGVFCKICGGCFETSPIEALGHADTVSVLTTPATCTADGEKTVYCTRCGAAVDHEVISASGHREGGWAEVTAATCTTAGKKICFCDACGEAYKSEEIAALGHDEGVWNVTVPASCITDGEETLVCTRCNAAVQTRAIAALGHLEDVWKTTVQPTCTTDGEQVCSCSRCGKQIASEKLPATGHDAGVWKVDFDATADHSGQKSCYCTKCQQVLASESFELHTHTQGDRQESLAATCTTDGEGGITCATCGAVYSTYVIPALGHDYGATSSNHNGTHVKTCARCHDVLTENCKYTVSTVPATCTTGGYTTHTCSVCGFAYTDEYTDALSHDFSEWKDDRDGLTHSRICTRCVLVERESHNWGDWGYDHNAGMFRAGTKTSTCSVCGAGKTDKANHTSWISQVFYPFILFVRNFLNKIVYTASLGWLFPEKNVSPQM